MIPERCRRLLMLVALLLVCFPALVFAQGSGGGGAPPPSDPPAGAPDDSYWSDGGSPPDITHLDVTDNPNGGTWNTATSAGGFTGVGDGSQGANAPNGDPTTWGSEVMTNASGEKFRVKNGKLQKKVNGVWKTLKKVKKPKKPKAKPTSSASHFGMLRLQAGDPAPCPGRLGSSRFGSVHLDTNEIAPFTGYFLPEDCGSLPVTADLTPHEEGSSLPSAKL